MEFHHLRRDDGDRLERMLQDGGLTEEGKVRLQWFIHFVDSGGNVETTCLAFGITPSTFRRWARRLDLRNPRSLEDRSRRPHTMREPETPHRVIALIREYRKRSPMMGKEKIAKRLESVHGVEISASTVGRIIARYAFFFANNPFHLRKRTKAAELGTVFDTPLSPEDLWAFGGPQQRTAGEGDGCGHSPLQSLFTLVLAIVAALTFGISSSHAAESTSYMLYDDVGNIAEDGPKQSTNYLLNEDVATWRAMPGISTSFQIVLAPPASSPASSLSSSVSSTSEGVTEGGGRRDPGRTAQQKHSAVPPASSSSSAPTRHPTVPPKPGEPFPGVDFMPDFLIPRISEPVQPAPTLEERLIGANYYFGTTDAPAPEYPVDRGCLLRDLVRGRCTALFTLVAFLVFALALAIAGLALRPWIGISRRNWWFLALPFFIHKRSNERKADAKPSTRKVSHRRKRRTRRVRRRGTSAFVALALIVGTLWPAGATDAATTAPQSIVYNGHLLDSSGSPVASPVSVRFSFWNSTDHQAGDVTGAGAINTASSSYAGWNEVHTVTPNSQGYFSVQMGSATTLPDFSTLSTSTLLNLHLQVEVKASGASDTSYELLDFNTASDSEDRSPMRSVPFALNANLLDKREIGTGSGNIALLGPGGTFAEARIPGGTTAGEFVMDFDNTESSSISLQFGSTLAKTLKYDISNARFNFNDSVRIEGDLTVTGLINGVNIAGLGNSVDTYLKVSSGAGLTVSVGGGTFRLNGSVTNFAGQSNVVVANNATNYLFFGSGGLLVSTAGFPADESAIRLAEVQTTGGSVTSVTDRRILSSDDRERTVERFVHAEFPNASYQGDATNNVGQMKVSHDNITKRNFYAWTSTRDILQDYDIFVRVTLPSDFVGWVDNPLRFSYRSTSDDTANNRLDITVYDTNGAPVTLSGSAVNLASTAWAGREVEFMDGATWTPGQDMLLKFTVSARQNFQIHVGSFRLQHRELLAP
jgi:hypothetical protein